MSLSAHYIRLINLVAPCVVPYACYPRFPRPLPIPYFPWFVGDTCASFGVAHASSSSLLAHGTFRQEIVAYRGPCSALLRSSFGEPL